MLCIQEFFDTMNYRLSRLRQHMVDTNEAEGWGDSLERIRELERKLHEIVGPTPPLPALLPADPSDIPTSIDAMQNGNSEHPNDLPIYLRDHNDNNNDHNTDGKYNQFMKRKASEVTNGRKLHGTNNNLHKKRKRDHSDEEEEKEKEDENENENEEEEDIPDDLPRIALDNPFPIQIAGDGKIYLPIAWKTWMEWVGEPTSENGGGEGVVEEVERDGRWVWSYSTRAAHLFLSFVATLDCYYSQVLQFEITEQSLWLAWKYLGK